MDGRADVAPAGAGNAFVERGECFIHRTVIAPWRSG
jgi:hypothetical protein